MSMPAGHLSPQDRTVGGARSMKSLTCSPLHWLNFEWQQSVQKDQQQTETAKVSEVKTCQRTGTLPAFQELGPTGLEKRQQI